MVIIVINNNSNTDHNTEAPTAHQELLVGVAGKQATSGKSQSDRVEQHISIEIYTCFGNELGFDRQTH